MGPEWGIIFGVVAAAALVGAGIWIGVALGDDARGALERELGRVTGERDRLKADIRGVIEREVARAGATRKDLLGAEDVARGVASGDLDRVREHFPDTPIPTPPSQPGHMADPDGG